MTGGVGHDELERFQKYHFIGNNPEDTKLVPVSRTIGTDSIVDEMLFSGRRPNRASRRSAVDCDVRFENGNVAHEQHDGLVSGGIVLLGIFRG